MNNKQMNEMLSGDFLKAQPIHRFRSKKDEKDIIEVRKSHNFFYLAVFRSGRFDIITIQSAIKTVHPEISKRRLEDVKWKTK